MKQWLMIPFLALPAMWLSASVGFEPEEAHAAGEAIGVAAGWRGKSLITDARSRTGSQSLEVSAETIFVLENSPTGLSFAYLDFWIKPFADDSDEPLTTVDFGGAMLAFLREESKGVLYVVDKRNETGSRIVKEAVPLDEHGFFHEWLRITIRRDARQGIWDLFVDGRPVTIGVPLETTLPLTEKTISTHLSPPAGAVAYVDDFSVGWENPLFKDSDHDAMPDFYEIAHGMNPYLDDRAVVRNGDGGTNIARFWQDAGQEPALSSPPREGSGFIFVDNQNGSDRCTGRMSYRVTSDGPKASLEAAVDVATSNDVIILLPSPLPYSISAISNSKKTINLRPVDRASLR